MPAQGLAVRIEGLSKTFVGTRALDDVSLDVAVGEVHALVGRNGSGKSTLIKCLSGYYSPDPGVRSWWHGEPIEFAQLAKGAQLSKGRQRATADEHHPIRFVHQTLGLVNQLSTLDNFILHSDHTRTRAKTVAWKAEAAAAEELIGSFGADIDILRPLSDATPV